MNNEVKRVSGLSIASIVLGCISIFGGFLFIVFPIIGLVLGLCEKEKSSAKTIGIVLNSIALGLAVLTGCLIGLIINLAIKYDGDGLFDNIKERIIDEVGYSELEGYYVSEDGTIKIELYNNKYGLDNDGTISKGFYTSTKLNKESKEFESVSGYIDGVIDEDYIYELTFINKEDYSHNKYLVVKFNYENKYFIYSVSDESYDYYIKENEYNDIDDKIEYDFEI